VFYATFFNSGLLMLLASLDHKHDKFNDSDVNKGIYTDYNAYWFIDIGGTVASAMVTNMLYPAIEFVMYWCIRHLYRALDQGAILAN